MFRRVKANVHLPNENAQQSFQQALENQLSGVGTHEDKRSHSAASDGPRSGVDVRTENAVDADELYQMIADKIDKIPAVSGEVAVHDCTHDEGPPYTPCSPDSEYQI